MIPAHDPTQFNMAAYVLGAGGQRDDAPALEVVGPSDAELWRYGDLRRAVRGIAAGFLAQGLAPGDRVLLRLGNTPTFPLAYLGAQWAGLVPVPTSAQLTGPEISGLAQIVRPALVVAAPGIACPDTDAPVIPAARLADWHALPPAPAHLGPAERLGYVVFTSGSGGRPKAVAHAHRAILARALMWQGWYGLRPTDRVMHAGAFNWTYTLGTGLMDPWSIGATALIPAPGTDSAALPALLARAQATLFAAAPGVYRQMLRAPFPPLPKLRHGLSAGEALADPIPAAWRAATGTAIHEALGMSECSTFVSGSPARPAPPGTTGYPQPGRRVAVLDAAGFETDTGTLAVHRSDPGLMLGYWQGGAPQLPLCGDWFETGDQVARTPGGALRYLGRADDMMNPGGFRLSPLEIEGALRACEGAGEVAVVEVRPTPDTGLIAAFYTGPCPPAALRAHATETLAAYKRPHLIIPLGALPRTATAKLDRRALRAHPAWRQALRRAP